MYICILVGALSCDVVCPIFVGAHICTPPRAVSACQKCCHDLSILIGWDRCTLQNIQPRYMSTNEATQQFVSAMFEPTTVIISQFTGFVKYCARIVTPMCHQVHATFANLIIRMLRNGAGRNF